MAVTPEETQAQKAAEDYAQARESAWGWAQCAATEYREALRQEDYAREHASSTYLRDAVADARVAAQLHHGRAAGARQLAEMWARVATVLVPPLEPVHCELVTTDA
ncbi:hypothetical protein PYK79_13405 [Streptomyces sp. ID05-04B]|uniref:hypothetical protein n=1 Tax=Streptomyces sp. ID05-04B TaxID=3028661 RepID=UPI0029C23271|nr:hypothetical protein [Streptomyces sp. ID05-04B]MDX5564143.1 hypothetical protein [Streptomyces sp. ID05-04B]